jgi:hypothetical protein
MFEEKEDFVGDIMLDTDNTVDPSDSGYMLRPHRGYSAALRVSHLLHRLEPYSSWYLNINGHVEVPNRIAYNFQNMITDLKARDAGFPFCIELLPEFFYFPEIFTNENCLNFGEATREEGGKNYNIDQWWLPKWALNHHDMVRVMRETLESKFVHENLGQWIDLQFGVDQFNRDKFNEFYPWLYSDWWDRSSEMYDLWKKKKLKDNSEDEYFDLDSWHMMFENIIVMNMHGGFQVPLKLFSNPVM